MMFRWLLGLLLAAILVGPQAQVLAQQQLSSDPVRLVGQEDAGITVDFASSFADFQQTPAYATILSNARSDFTRQETLSGGSFFPVISTLVGLPPTGAVDLQVLTDDALPVSDARLLSAGASVALQTDLPVRLVDVAWVRDRRIARLEFRPFQLQSAGQSGLWHQRLRVQLHFAGAPVQSASGALSPSTDWAGSADVLSQLINATQARGWAVTPALSGAIQDPFADAPNTPLGPRYKIVVDQDGFYRLTATDLQNAGLNLTGVDPHYLHLTSQGLAIPIYIQGESDSVFDSGDYVLFYGQKFRGDRLASRHTVESSYYTSLSNGWHPQYSAVQAEKYTAENVYWLTVETTPGLRASELAAPPIAAQPATVTRETLHFEQSNHWWSWHYTGEDTWFWDRLNPTGDSTTQLTGSYALDLPTPAASSAQGVTISGDLVARFSNVSVNPDHHTKIVFNTTTLEDVKWDGPTRHHFTVTKPRSALLDTNNILSITVKLDAYTGQVTDDVYFDWVEVTYDRNLTAQSDALAFTAPASTSRYQVTNFASPQIELWNITQPFAPVRLTGFTTGSNTLNFETPLTSATQFIAAGASAWKTPKSITYYTPPDLLSSSVGADYIIITHSSLVAASQALAARRQAQGLRVKVIDFADLVNQFNDGIYNPIAIKNFLAYTFLYWQTPAPAYVVLVGDGNWNLRGFNPSLYGSAPIYLPPNLAWVDYPDVSIPNQGEIESTNLLANVVGTDPLPDLAIGRIPVNSVAELNAVINKITSYEGAASNQAWQKRFLFVAGPYPDSAGDFQGLSNAIIADYMKTTYQPLTAYQASASDESTQHQAIINGLNNGALVVSYVGHGSKEYWTSRYVFSIPDISTYLANGNRLPFILSMTCSDGYWIMPPIISNGLAEELLRADNKGAIATFSPTGFGDVYGHDKLERGIMSALTRRFVTNIGALSTAGLLNVYAGGSSLELIHQFVLFGDPALNLKLSHLSTYLPAVRR